MKNIINNIFIRFLLFVLSIFILTSFQIDQSISLKKECTKSLIILADDLINIQNQNLNDKNYGALYCKACADYHTRASESVLPFAVAYKESGNEKYLKAALSTADWLIKKQNEDGSWFETPSEWTGTTTDQLLSLSADVKTLSYMI